MHCVIVVHYILIYNIIYYAIWRCNVLRGIVLYVPSLTATFDGPFVGGIRGRISKWAVDWIIRSLIYRMSHRQDEAFIRTYLLSPSHSFADWPIC